MSTTDLNKAIDEWKNKVLSANDSQGMIDTFAMIKDIDRIIADAFDHAPIIDE